MAASEKIALIGRAQQHGSRPAITSSEGAYTYSQLLERSGQIGLTLLDGKDDLKEQRVAFLTPKGFHYVALQWGIWRAGGIAVPLGEMHPVPELEYFVRDSGASIIVAHPKFAAQLRPVARNLKVPFFLTEELLSTAKGSLPQIDPSRRAMILYTSGTTGKAKGVVSTHLNIQAQIISLVEAWGWVSTDYILHVLPLHHVHGIINVLACALWAGARCEFLPRFDPLVVWQKFHELDLTLFMAVPTIYLKLIDAWETATPQERKLMREGCQKFRLMVSGSAALPTSLLAKWKAITGHTILERYGMTEIGMALSNPLHGERVPGFVGFALPQVEVRLVDDGGNPLPSGASGEIQVRGPGVFLEYWQRPEETKKSFRHGWFSTGDVAIVEKGIYRILGRKSTDIIKTGGYKVSALEIEETLLTHPAIKECGVVGIEDPEWGERVGAALILQSGGELTLEELRIWGKKRLAPYKVPSRFVIVDDLPRNSLGKVKKVLLKKLFKETK